MDARELIQHFARKERKLRGRRFVAPALPGGRVRVRLDGVIQELDPRPASFEGWGLYRALPTLEAELLSEASARLVEEYLQLLKRLRLRLVRRLARGRRTWLAYPVGEEEARRRFGVVRPLLVHLVDDEADVFEQVKVRSDGAAFWYEDLDRGAEARFAGELRQALLAQTPPHLVRIRDLTPEARTAYRLAYGSEPETPGFDRDGGMPSDEDRLRGALDFAGGELRGFSDRGEYWVVQWATRDGREHSSAITKEDLTVLSSGICLDGRDRDFDLQSLVGVIERADDWDDRY